MFAAREYKEAHGAVNCFDEEGFWCRNTEILSIQSALKQQILLFLSSYLYFMRIKQFNQCLFDDGVQSR